VLAGLLTGIGLPLTPEQSIETFLGQSWKKIQAWAGERGVTITEEFRIQYREAMFEAFEESLVPVPGVIDALDAIALPSCVASSGSHEKMQFTLGHTGLLERFDGRLFSAFEVEHGKPAPDLFLHAARSMGWEPAECAVVEDSPAGIAAARAAGMTAFGYAGRTHAAELDGARVFSDMAELPALLQPS
jgi:HAD superfamily hydrolase (TIGR01509 family)